MEHQKQDNPAMFGPDVIDAKEVAKEQAAPRVRSRPQQDEMRGTRAGRHKRCAKNY